MEFEYCRQNLTKRSIPEYNNTNSSPDTDRMQTHSGSKVLTNLS